jgi:hypothetical protein
MADQQERIVLEIDDSPAVAASNRANKSLEAVEKGAERVASGAQKATEEASRTILSVTEKSRSSIERLVAAAEKKAAFAGNLSGSEKLAAERDLAVKRVAGDDKAVERVTAAYQKLIDAQRASERETAKQSAMAERNKMLEAAVRASQKAAAASDDFARALGGVNRAAADAAKKQQEQAAALERQTRAAAAESVKRQEDQITKLERQSRLVGATGADRIRIEKDEFLKGLGVATPEQIARVNAAYGKLIQHQEKTISLSERVAAAIRNPLQTAASAAEGLATKLGPVGIVASAVTAGIGFLGGKLYDLVKAKGAAAEASINLADRLGITVGKAEQLEAMAEIAGVNIGVLEGSSRLLAAALEDAGGQGDKTTKALARLGISTTAYVGGGREMGTVLVELLDKLSKVESQNERVRIANETLGRGSKELLPLIKNYAALQEIVQKLGVGVDEDMTEKLARADDQLGVFSKRWSLFTKTIAARVGIPALEFINGFLDRVEAIGRQQQELTGQAAAQFDSKKLTDREIGRFSAATREQMAKQSLDLMQQQRVAGRELSAAYVAEAKSLTDVESITTRVNILKKEQSTLDKDLRSGQLLAGSFRKAKDQFDANAAEIKALQAQKKAIEDAPSREREAEQAAKRNREAARDLERKFDNVRKKIFNDELKQTNEAILSDIKSANEAEAIKADIRDRAFADSEAALRESFRTREEIELQGLAHTRDAQLRELGLTHAKTVEEKVAVEQRKAAIETEYLEQSFARERDMVDRRGRLAIEEQAIRAQIAGATDEQLSAIRYNLQAKLNADLAGLDARHTSDVARTRDEAAVRSAHVYRDEHEKAFTQVKNSVDGLFDAALAGAKSFGDAIKRILFVSFLSPIKNGLSTFIAGVATGQRQTGGTAAQSTGGLLGRFGFGGVLGGSAGYGGNGTTPPFVPVGTSTSGGGSRGILGLAGGQAAGFKGMLAQLGNIGYGPKGGDFGGEVAGSYRGVGGIKGGAMLAGGGILAFDGLRRGGLTGLAETTAGGALIGAKFGGPLGAAIGAGIGATAGFIRLFIKGAEQKAIEKVQAIYSLRIDRSLAKTIVAQAKQTYGGDLDLAIRSPQVRDLLELYAMSTGQKFSGSSNQVRPLTLVQNSGGLFEAPSYRNGSLLSSLGGNVQIGQAATQPTTVVVKLDGPATTQLLQGQVVQTVQNNPGTVAQAAAQATRQSIGRRDMMAMQFAPGAITA